MHRSLTHKASSDFWLCYNQLPAPIKKQADRAFGHLKQNPRHPALHFERLKGNNSIWSARVNDDYRALAANRDDTFVWFWIGSHAEYDSLVARLA